MQDGTFKTFADSVLDIPLPDRQAEAASVVREVVTVLEIEHGWPLADAISDTAEVLGVTRATVFEAWLFGDRYTGGGFAV